MIAVKENVSESAPLAPSYARREVSPQTADSSIDGAFGRLASYRGQCPSVQDNFISLGGILAITVPACLFWKRQGCSPETKPAQLFSVIPVPQLPAFAIVSVSAILPCLRSHTAWSTTRCFGRRPVLVAMVRLPAPQRMTRVQHETTFSKVFFSSRGALALPPLRSRKQHVPRALLQNSS